MITQVIKTPTKAPPHRTSQADPPRVADQSAWGYTYQFVKTPPEIVRCVICHLPSKDRWYLSECCEHNVCATCLQQCKTTPCTKNACPMCSNISFKAFQINKLIEKSGTFTCIVWTRINGLHGRVKLMTSMAILEIVRTCSLFVANRGQ